MIRMASLQKENVDNVTKEKFMQEVQQYPIVKTILYQSLKGEDS